MTDRQLVYPGALPADTDILGLQRDIMIAIGYLAQAALGTEVELNTLDGPYELSVPAGVQTGRVLKVAGHGVPRLRGGRRGDILVSVFVDTPVKLSKEEDELLRKLAALRGEQVQPPDPGLLSRLRSAFG